MYKSVSSSLSCEARHQMLQTGAYIMIIVRLVGVYRMIIDRLVGVYIIIFPINVNTSRKIPGVLPYMTYTGTRRWIQSMGFDLFVLVKYTPPPPLERKNSTISQSEIVFFQIQFFLFPRCAVLTFCPFSVKLL